MVLLTDVANSNITLWNSFVEKIEYRNLYLLEWVHWNNYYDEPKPGQEIPNSIYSLSKQLVLLSKTLLC